jgi:hypothetical protein
MQVQRSWGTLAHIGPLGTAPARLLSGDGRSPDRMAAGYDEHLAREAGVML